MGILGVLVTTSPAMASPGEVYGASARAIGRAGAVAASASGFESLHYNPSGLTSGERVEISAGYRYSMRGLSWESAHEGAPVASGSSSLPTPHALELGLAVPMGKRLALGAYASTMPTNLIRLRAGEPEAPYFPYFDNRAERLYLLVGAAAKLNEQLSFGLAVNAFARVNGLASATEGATRDVEPLLIINARTMARLIFGFRYQFDEKHGLGFTFRQRFEVPISVETQNAVSGVPFTVDVRSAMMRTPNQVILGYFRRFGDLQLELDFGWYRFSQLRAPLIEVDADILGIPLSSGPREKIFRDSVELRLGGEYGLGLKKERELMLRAGVHYHSPIAREAVGPSNAMDGHKLGGSVGAGMRFVFGDFAARTDLYFMTTGLLSRESVKDPSLIFDENPRVDGVQTSNPGYSRLSGGGAIYALGFNLTLELPK